MNNIPPGIAAAMADTPTILGRTRAVYGITTLATSGEIRLSVPMLNLIIEVDDGVYERVTFTISTDVIKQLVCAGHKTITAARLDADACNLIESAGIDAQAIEQEEGK